MLTGRRAQSRVLVGKYVSGGESSAPDQSLSPPALEASLHQSLSLQQCCADIVTGDVRLRWAQAKCVSRWRRQCQQLVHTVVGAVFQHMCGGDSNAHSTLCNLLLLLTHCSRLTCPSTGPLLSRRGPRHPCRVRRMAKKSPSSLMAFDPDSVVPNPDIKWADFVTSTHKQVKSHLPRRLALAAFSNKVGWRPAGLNVGQVKLFVERFPQEFRLASMGRIILPHLDGAPFVAPDGKLPCPMLSSCNALKVLQSPGKLDGAHIKVRLGLERVFKDGLQVEWQEFPDYMSYMVYYEGAAVQGEVLVKPHIIDTAMLFLGFCGSKRGRALQLQAAAASGDGAKGTGNSQAPEGIVAFGADDPATAAAEAIGSGGTKTTDPEPAEILGSTAKMLETLLGEGSKALEDGFIQAMNGKAAHRFQDAKRLLRSTELDILTKLSSWRKRSHFCHANALSQQWFLTPEWRQLKHCTLRSDIIEHGSQKPQQSLEASLRQSSSPPALEASLHQGLSLQQCCADIITKMLSQTEIVRKADVPKLGRSVVNTDVFKEVTMIPLPALDYFNGLRQKHPRSWLMLPAGSKLARRLLVDGEAGLRHSFLALYEQMNRSVCAMSFMDSAVGSDFAMVEEKLHACTIKLLAEAQKAEDAAQKVQEAERQAAAAEEAALEKLFALVEGTGASKGAEAGHGAGTPRAEVARVKTEELRQNAEEQARLREKAAAEQVRQATAERMRKEQEQESDSIRSEARIAIDDVWTIYNDIPRKGCPPAPKVQRTQQVVYIVPTQSYVRGRPEAIVPVLQMQGLEILDWVTARDTILVGVGHDPTIVPVLLAKLKARSDNIKTFNWQPLIPVVQPKQKKGCAAAGSYLEYLLIGRGPEYSTSAPAFLQVRNGFPSVRLRPTHCSKCVPGAQPSGILADGCEEVCDIHTWARSRFTSPLLGNPPKRQKKPQQVDAEDLSDLLGGGDASAESDDGSGDGGGAGVGDAEQSEEEQGWNAPRATEVGKPWLNAWRWGWAPETWTAFLESLSPSLVVLCGSVHLQPGLLMSVLSYNDARFGLDRCELIAFYPRDCASQDVDVRPRAKHLEQGHIADHVLERVSSAYADFRLTAHRAARKRHLRRAESAAEEGSAAKTPAAGGEAVRAAAVAAPTPTAGAAASGEAATASAACADGGGEAGAVSGITATKFIAIHSNAGPKMSLITLPATRSDEDSDAEETGATAASMVHSEVSKRNQNMMTKHKVKVSRSTGPEGTGIGLFAEAALGTGTSIPVKGIWFDSLSDLNSWLGAQPTRTAEVMAKKVVEANFCEPSDTETKVVKYFVMTSIAGYVNAYTNITQRPNAQLLFDVDRPLGQYSLKLVLTQDLAADREILVAYGAKHLVRERKPCGLKVAGAKRKRTGHPKGEEGKV